MSDIREIESAESVDVSYGFSDPGASSPSSSENPSLVSLNTNRPLDGSSQRCFSIPVTTNSNVIDNDAKNQNRKSSEGAESKKGTRSRPSSALAQAKMNARKLKSAPSPPPVVIKDPLQPARDAKDSIRRDTGVVYDMEMVEHRNIWDPTHPERPERFTSIIERCIGLGLLERCKSIAPRYASLPEILPLHSVNHFEKLQEICTKSESVEDLEETASGYDCVYFHPSTFELALLACGSTIDLVRNIVAGNIQNGMAIVRPPGHHAMKDEYCGYCYFNNVAIAAQQILQDQPSKRILIVDFDVHHGQGTQQMFYNDPRVLYFSTHRFEHGTYWPNLEESNFHWIGSEDGLGFNVNIPLNTTGLNNTDFLTVWHKILIPIAYQFEPDLVIVSAGYDAALGCPEGIMRVTPQCYPHLLSPLLGLANGKVAVILEGGYCLKSLAEGAALTLRTLLGDPCPFIQPIHKPNPIIVETILSSMTILKEFWQHFGVMKSVGCDEFEASVENDEGFRPIVRFEWNEPKPVRYPTRDSYPHQSEEIRVELDQELDRLILSTSLAVAKHRVGLVYDDIMLKHKNTLMEHPECPERISNIFACHVSFGLVERCHRIEARKATIEELSLVHTDEHIRRMRNTASLSSKDLCNLQDRFNSIYFNSNSYESSLYAAGSLLSIVDNVLDGTCQSGVGIIRPPGHHAEEDTACGFCLFNNVSLAAKYAIENHGLKRILIVDWDVHHGNGIQHMFDEDPRVLYISLHRYDNGMFFPCSTDANYSCVGSGTGAGFNVNIPWNRRGMGDTEYLAAFTNIILPIAYEYSPELVLVSAGFDAAIGDPLGGCRVSPEGYAHMTHLLSSLANGRVILALEGGYNLTSISYSMSLCTKALFGDPIPPLKLNGTIDKNAIETIRNVIQTHSKYWTVLDPFQRILPSSSPVKPQVYKVEKTDSETVGELIQKLELGETGETRESESENDRLDFNANPTPALIPDPPTSGGEPSLSFPTATPTALQRRSNAHENTAAGGGEMHPNEIQAIPVREAMADGGVAEQPEAEGGAAIAVAGPAGGEVQLEGAVGGSEHVIELSFDDVDGMFAVVPLTWCPHLTSVNPVPPEGIDIYAPCEDCHSTAENWVCLSCYSVRCSRYVREHMVMHREESGHNMALSFSDLSVWCFACDNYVHSPELESAKQEVHDKKFGVM